MTVIPTYQRHRPPNRRPSEARIVEDEGQSYRVALGRDLNGKPCELFVDALGKAAGSAIQRHVSATAILASILMQSGFSLREIGHSISGPVAIALDLFDGETPMT
jgi:hypothetical protein